MENLAKDSENALLEIRDDTLIIYFCKLLKKKKVKFLEDTDPFDIYDDNIEELQDVKKYKDITSEKLRIIFKDLLIEGKERAEKARVLKLKKIIFQKLWPNFVRYAIQFLRIKDKRDLGALKFDLGVKNLMKYFKEFSKFEELLYGIDEYYRDHSLHVFRVYLLGEYLTQKHLKGYDNISILNKPKDKPEAKILIEESEKEALWCITALCHDLGYPLQKLEALNKRLVKILNFYGTSNYNPLRYGLPLEGIVLDKYIIKLISSRITDDYKIHFQSKFFTKYSNAYEKLSHGIMSCILLMKNLVYFKETDYRSHFSEGFHKKEELFNENIRQFLIRREILRSIASHDNDDIYHINMNNFLFLLIICDEIQEWSRPSSNRRVLYPLDDENNEIINILSFNNEKIDISITLNLPKNDLEKYVRKKFRKFIKLLRSAVDSHKRTFDFKMLIKNKENIEYLFEYDNPQTFFKEKMSTKELYSKPRVKKKNSDGKVDESFTLKSIIEFLS